jgi:hypothetical protein
MLHHSHLHLNQAIPGSLYQLTLSFFYEELLLIYCPCTRLFPNISEGSLIRLPSYQGNTFSLTCQMTEYLLDLCGPTKQDPYPYRTSPL